MIDLTGYSDDELSLQVMNDEYLYIERSNVEYLLAMCAEAFIYTDEQLEVLKTDLKGEDTDYIESYVNGNISFVREHLVNATYSLSEFLDQYVAECDPSVEDVQLFIRRLSQ